jgi:hypothetical protein
MELMIVTKDNRDAVILALKEAAKDKKYWLGIGFGRITNIEDPAIDWFRGAGTFERIVSISFSENIYHDGIEISHINEVEKGTKAVPSASIIPYGAELKIDGADILYFTNNRLISPRGGTGLYMEWTEARHEMYKVKGK